MSQNVIPVFTDSKYVQSSWFHETICGLEASAARHRLSVQIFETDCSLPDLQALSSVVIVIGGAMNPLTQIVSYLHQAGKQILLAGIDASFLDIPASCVTLDRSEEMNLLISYLYRCNRCHIALFGFQPDSVNDITRHRAALFYARLQGFPIESEDVYFCQPDFLSCFRAFQNHVQKYDAVICPNDVVAVSFIRHALEAGISIPKDLYVTGTGDLMVSKYCRPSVTTIAMDFHTVGTETFTLWNVLRKNSTADKPLYLKASAPGTLIIRGSTGHIPLSVDKRSDLSVEFQEDSFYDDPTIQNMVRFENCLLQRDAVDLQIIRGILAGLSYEAISESCFLSVSTVRYRISKIFADAKVSGKTDFLRLAGDCFYDTSFST